MNRTYHYRVWFSITLQVYIHKRSFEIEEKNLLSCILFSLSSSLSSLSSSAAVLEFFNSFSFQDFIISNSFKISCFFTTKALKWKHFELWKSNIELQLQWNRAYINLISFLESILLISFGFDIIAILQLKGSSSFEAFVFVLFVSILTFFPFDDLPFLERSSCLALFVSEWTTYKR